jgi:hypothetical protein
MIILLLTMRTMNLWLFFEFTYFGDDNNNNGTDCRRGKVIWKSKINLLPAGELMWKTVGKR